MTCTATEGPAAECPYRGGRRVKKLEWHKNHETGGYYGEGAFGQRWQIEHRAAFERSPWDCYFDGAGGEGPAPALGYFPTLEAAKADAQADYEARILACLEDEPDAVAEAARVLLDSGRLNDLSGWDGQPFQSAMQHGPTTAAHWRDRLRALAGEGKP
ncbi:hypothetical protein D1114_16675 [Cereibacter sphaeroides]|uniref:HNH endonuclease n=1 Tax=Cereibacter sphaeroides TaxID=1063 RepID=A0AAX1UII1_CERSP|nr:hypothetical protein [Cereibacter sphaeroides]RHZ92836.1 hypothetical protein D1114_16675 [Cereibacter sphaeroides]